jgi:RNA polymerase sigma factor (sigma-70 family)
MPRPANLLSAEDLERTYRPGAVNVAYSIVRHAWPERSDEAEDIANEAMEKMIAYRHQHDGVRPLWPWLHRIVQNTAIDRLRRFAGPLLGDADGAVLNSAHTPDEEVEIEEERALARGLVAEAVDTLGPREKVMFLRFYVHDEPFTTLAKAFTLAEQTVRAALSKAKKAVLARLGLGRLTNAELKQIAAFAYAATAHDTTTPTTTPTAASPLQFHATSEEPTTATTTDSNNRDRPGNPIPANPPFPKPDKVERDTQMCRRHALRAAIGHLLGLGWNPARHDRMMCVLNNRDAGLIAQDECDRLWAAFAREFGIGE